jgi:hypothetical protein
VLVAIVRRRPLTVPAPIARRGGLVPPLAIAIIAGLNVQAWFGETALRVPVAVGMLHRYGPPRWPAF